MSFEYGTYILSKTDTLIVLFRTMVESEGMLLAPEIELWDWEVENTIEGYAQLSEGVILAKGAERRVSVKGAGSNLGTALSILINTWNLLIEIESASYSELSEEDKREISPIDIDFDLYLKELV